MSDKNAMDLKKVKEIVELMKENDLVEVEIVDGDTKIHLKRPGADIRVIQQATPMQSYQAAPAPVAASPAPAEKPSEKVDEGLLKIISPIVGTFFQAPSPDSEPYVKVGDKVDADTVVCIVEAMKVMNEIKAEVNGTVVEVCCKDGEAVEYGQSLFKVRP